MNSIFEPLAFAEMTLKNRVVMLPMRVGMDLASEQARAFYVERAHGGVGTIVTAATELDRFLPDLPSEAGKAHGFLAGIRQLAESVHAASPDVKIAIQLFLRNLFVIRNSDGAHMVAEWVAPSPWTEPTPRIHAIPPGTTVRALTKAEILQLVADYGTAAAKVREAGFDLVEIHLCHGGLACQFLTPFDNRREDEYGGDLKGRMRFGLEVGAAIRHSVGSSFPISYRLSAIDHCDGGLTIDESCHYALQLQKAGVNLFSITVGISTKEQQFVHISPNRRHPMGTYAELAAAIKKVVDVPVIAAGRINTPEVAEEILARQQADLVGIGRQLLADPLWVDKVKHGRTSEIVTCDSCNLYCWRNNGYVKTPPGFPICRPNVRAGREWELPPAASAT